HLLHADGLGAGGDDASLAGTLRQEGDLALAARLPGCGGGGTGEDTQGARGLPGTPTAPAEAELDAGAAGGGIGNGGCELHPLLLLDAGTGSSQGDGVARLLQPDLFIDPV